jgi:branched-chain amino acid transport system substrate-binding protein
MTRSLSAAFGGALLALSLAHPAAAQEKVLKIGVLTDMSSVAVDEMGPGSVLAAQIAAEDMGGTVAGMKIQIIAGDHQQKPDVGVSVARRWFDQEGVDAIVDVPNSSIGLAVNKLARDANKVFMPSSSQTMQLTGPQCSPNTVRWTIDTFVTSHTLPRALMKDGANKTWFFIHTDNTYGRDLTANATKAVQDLGGKVVGTVAHAVGLADFSSFVVQAKTSNADVIGLATYSQDLNNFLKQAGEFGLIRPGGPKMAGFVLSSNNVRAAGLRITQNLYTASSFYWDLNDDTRKFAQRFNPRHPRKIYVNEFTAGVYGSVLHYLKAVKALGSAADGRAVVAKMKEMPTDDVLHGKGYIRVDGSVIHPIYLMQVKTPAESKADWDFMKLVATLPGEQAFGPLDKSCFLVK